MIKTDAITTIIIVDRMNQSETPMKGTDRKIQESKFVN